MQYNCKSTSEQKALFSNSDRQVETYQRRNKPKGLELHRQRLPKMANNWGGSADVVWLKKLSIFVKYFVYFLGFLLTNFNITKLVILFQDKNKMYKNKIGAQHTNYLDRNIYISIVSSVRGRGLGLWKKVSTWFGVNCRTCCPMELWGLTEEQGGMLISCELKHCLGLLLPRERVAFFQGGGLQVVIACSYGGWVSGHNTRLLPHKLWTL